MTTKYFLAPNARWQGRDQTGQPCIGGKLYTYVNHSSDPKATYQDKDGSNPNTNPVTLDGKGEANIYWASDDLYSIELKDSKGNTVYTQDDYPYVDSDGSDVSTVSTVTNLIRNPQFSWWSNTATFSPVFNATNQYDYVADDWTFARDTTSAVIEISRGTFDGSETTVPGNPIYYLHYSATSAGSGESYRRLSQFYQGVRSLAGKTVVVSFWAKRGSTPVSLGVTLRQNFGSGGSAEVPNQIIAPTILTESWAQYTNFITLPSVAGKTINSGNALFFDFDFGINTTGEIDICDVQMQLGTEVTDFPYQTVDEQFKHLDTNVNEAVFATGDYKNTLASTAPAGWVLCNDGTIGSPQSGAGTAVNRCKALYELIWGAVTNIYAPIYDSAGVATTRGANAQADFNANKRLSLTRVLGRVLSGANPSALPIVSEIFTASSSSGLLLTVPTAESFYTGTKVRVSNSGGALPTGLSPGTDYYCISISTTTLKLATSFANALAGTAIAFTDAGTGVNTIFTVNAAHALASYLGEETHAQTDAELKAHGHGVTLSSSFESLVGHKPGAGQSMDPASGDETFGAQVTINNSSGGTSPFNIIQPTLYVNVMLKL